ncbi:cation-transporting P-type ATPase [Patescibacteria group bacterium]|nr:cation-transporting P-type ATPase [Patescibacteria group bacterium]MBU1683433.1 cation-transporting P-type ATPase [Patescibacteria group bacterium]MBU1935500.1 cation-transporting P-type ATPase [Patescibacteria group bacterium]
MPKISKIVGLSKAEAEKAFEKFGPNELKEKREFATLKVFFRQFTNVIVWILIIATAISYGIGEVINFWVINFIIVFVIFMGFLQEFKAEKAMKALRNIVRPQTTVIRDGKLMQIEAREVVPGDILSLEVGDLVPADSKVLQDINVEIDESMLTGESLPARKTKDDLIYAGTQVINGRLHAEVVAIGMKTRLGDIATMIQEKEEITPLQRRMDRLGKFLAIIALSASVIILILGITRGATATEMLIVALALAVAAVPEGLPLTMTLALSFGMHKMAKKKAIVRRMMAVETLGSTTVICTDKTGTLTENEMTVQKIFIDNEEILVTGAGYKPVGEFKKGNKNVKSLNKWSELFKACTLCNNADIYEEKNRWLPVGDPTEVSLMVLGAKAGYIKEELDESYKRTEEILFTPERKMMTTVNKIKNEYLVYTKGAPEEVLKLCTHQLLNGKHHKLDKEDIKTILKKNQEFAQKGLRVMAIATKSHGSKKIPSKDIEKDLMFLGLVAMKDPARPEVKEALEVCKQAGIKVVMITGDNEHTAISIARQIGLANGRVRAITGGTMDKLTDKELLERLKETHIFARTQPEHKLRIVNLLRGQGEIVAMTGDGINDAPALKKADIGIAMGIKGTDVSKQASDMILQDDNFVTIVEAVKEGRRIYENIEKFSAYLISRNFTEVILIFLGILLFDFKFLPLLALQILFINAFDEEMPAIGLGLDQAHGDLMQRPPRPPDENILNKGNAFIVFSIAVFSALISFIIFIMHNPIDNIEKARTMVFATIVSMVIVGTYNFRSLRASIALTGVFNNKFLLFAVVSIFATTLFVMYFPVTQKIFVLSPLNFTDWIICIGASLLNLVYMEMIKWFRRNFENNKRLIS